MRKPTWSKRMGGCSRASRRALNPWPNGTSCIELLMYHITVHLPAGSWPTDNIVGTITLDFDARHRRRMRLMTDQGSDILLDLPKAVAMADGDGLEVESGKWLKILAAEEPIVEARHDVHAQLARLAWHLGNRHLPTEIRPTSLRIRPDHVIEHMLKSFGAVLLKTRGAFQPEGGAYAGRSSQADDPHHKHSHE